MEFWHKKPFSICFVHKSRKFSNFKPTLDYIMLRNFGTVFPIFPENSAKSCARLQRKKSWKLVRKNFPQTYRAKQFETRGKKIYWHEGHLMKLIDAYTCIYMKHWEFDCKLSYCHFLFIFCRAWGWTECYSPSH